MKTKTYQAITIIKFVWIIALNEVAPCKFWTDYDCKMKFEFSLN